MRCDRRRTLWSQARCREPRSPRWVVARLRALTLAIYARATAHAEARGIILADTKFEFGLRPGASGASARPVPDDTLPARHDRQAADVDRIVLIDEILTPDSSRFWPANTYAPGGPQASFDKQFVRDYLEAIRWNKQPPVPALPDDVVARTRAKYLDALERLTGRTLQ